MASNHRVVILGAGFGGIQTYLTLRKLAKGRNLTITLINRTNYFLFTPLLHEVATGGLGHHNVVEAVRGIIDRDPASFIQTDIHGFDMSAKMVHTGSGDVPYDTLVIATGATTAFYGIPGAENCLVLKDLRDALRLRNRLIDMFEMASKTKDSAERKKLLSFVVVGGGATGVETATEMADLFNDTFKRFYAGDFKRKEVSLTLISADPELLMPFHTNIRRHAFKALTNAGITVKLKMTVKEVTPEGIIFSDGGMLPAHTVVWAAGVTPHPMNVTPALVCDRGRRVMVDQFLRVQGQDRVFALGDAACFQAKPEDHPLPMLAQVAVRQGPIVAENIIRTLDKQPLKPFAFKMKGQLVSLGRFDAAAQIGPMHITGVLAWFIWRTAYYLNFHSWSKRLRVGTDWFVDLFFPRDITRA
jgi:NADH dehydrogenase